MKKYICDVCGWEYDPEVGVPEQNIAPGTAFEDLPEDFFCPLCDVGADQFSPLDWLISEKIIYTNKGIGHV